MRQMCDAWQAELLERALLCQTVYIGEGLLEDPLCSNLRMQQPVCTGSMLMLS